eukprot:GEMP01094075.1.p1 GENE.GEMP01094075.1~~GEMP01094075.1.p1  ORF type:complete len:244 (+),score=38.34 GEMP01094075.1:116-847(+)
MLYQFVVYSLLTYAGASSALFYRCDPVRYATQGLCFFKPSLSSPWGQGPLSVHNLDRAVGGDHHRLVVSQDNVVRTVGDVFRQTDTVVASPASIPVYGQKWRFAMTADLVLPLRDEAMSSPDTLTQNFWDDHAKALIDCGVNTTLEVSELFTRLKDPRNSMYNDADGNLFITVMMHFLELGGDALAHAMDTALDTCWVAGYESLYGSGAAGSAFELSPTQNSPQTDVLWAKAQVKEEERDRER